MVVMVIGMGMLPIRSSQREMYDNSDIHAMTSPSPASPQLMDGNNSSRKNNNTTTPRRLRNL